MLTTTELEEAVPRVGERWGYKDARMVLVRDGELCVFTTPRSDGIYPGEFVRELFTLVPNYWSVTVTFAAVV